MDKPEITILDSLYGQVTYGASLSSLIRSPMVQRLRHVRLSNVDSVSLPGIANLSRFEHILGVCHLVSHLGFARRVPAEDLIALAAAGLLHDWAISPFGHLVEESFAYASEKFDHEEKLLELMQPDSTPEIGGVDRQIFLGRETGISPWAYSTFGKAVAHDKLREITLWIKGEGRFGSLLHGEMDLDNLDNVVRVAFHLGLSLDRELPIRICSNIADANKSTGAPIFRPEAVEDINHWLQLREVVYNKLMLAEPDFSAKSMIIYATLLCIERREISTDEWNMTDAQLIERLLASKVEQAVSTAKRWLTGEYWNSAPLLWMTGGRPDYRELRRFSAAVSETLGRECFAYGIKDKRKRRLAISLTSGDQLSLGDTPKRWLFGLTSHVSRSFSTRELEQATELLCRYFQTQVIGPATTEGSSSDSEQMCLL